MIQSSRDAGYSVRRHTIITSYQGRWNGQANSQARLRASAGRTAGWPAKPEGPGSRHRVTAARQATRIAAAIIRPAGAEVADAVYRNGR